MMKFTKMDKKDTLPFSTHVFSGSYDSQRFVISTAGTKLLVSFAGENYILSFDEMMHEIAQDRNEAIKVAKEQKAVRKQETHF